MFPLKSEASTNNLSLTMTVNVFSVCLRNSDGISCTPAVRQLITARLWLLPLTDKHGLHTKLWVLVSDRRCVCLLCECTHVKCDVRCTDYPVRVHLTDVHRTDIHSYRSICWETPSISVVNHRSVFGVRILWFRSPRKKKHCSWNCGQWAVVFMWETRVQNMPSFPVINKTVERH